jgi:putative PIN family toxin of toxin-antitoxin system
MRVTLDTNVLVSAFISKKGHPARVLDIALSLEDVQLILSEQIIREFVRVMSRDELLVRFEITLTNVEELARLFRKTSQMIKVRSKFKPVKEDPADNAILNTAYDGKCEFVVSGDHHLLELKKFKGIRILSPRQMLDLMSRRYGSFVSGKAMSGWPSE